MHADCLTGNPLVAHIDLTGGIFTHQNDRQARYDAFRGQLSHAPRLIIRQIFRHQLSVKYLCHAPSSLSTYKMLPCPDHGDTGRVIPRILRSAESDIKLTVR
ncbi:hypothetical protein SDC9_90322 [bioreactor metagenome]|uniref:Uncharacterized protein n=1 Tax=bioreactor metagenome TaxID=1076179 RepID=A0A644ZRY7_9ZZZZ